jgi:hypothetical protein
MGCMQACCGWCEHLARSSRGIFRFRTEKAFALSRFVTGQFNLFFAFVLTNGLGQTHQKWLESFLAHLVSSVIWIARCGLLDVRINLSSHRHTNIRICVAECKSTQPSTTSAMSPGIGWWHLAHLLLRVRSHGLCIQDISHGLPKQAMPGLEQSARCLSSIQQPQRHGSCSATNGQCPMPDRSLQAPLTGHIRSRRLERQTASANTNPEQSRRWSPLHASAHCQGLRQSLPLTPARHPCCRAGT